MNSGDRREFLQKAVILSTFFAAFPARAGVAENLVKIINEQYGSVCQAELSGVFSKTLKIDWTSRTVKIQALKILGEIGSVKDRLYGDGVRYFQFPNSSGMYNVVDWKTGEKKTVGDRAPYYF